MKRVLSTVALLLLSFGVAHAEDAVPASDSAAKLARVTTPSPIFVCADTQLIGVSANSGTRSASEIGTRMRRNFGPTTW